MENKENQQQEEEQSNVFTTFNGAHIIDQSKGLEIDRWYFSDEDQPLSVITLQDNTRLSDFIDRLPYGIIDKGITGIGATTLELKNDKRNSIIVVPTKSLAYKKCIEANKVQEGYCMYVGSNIGEIKQTPSAKVIARYLKSREVKVKKFITVADSLGTLLKHLEANGIDWIKDYFLLVDEIDTMQEDSAYRPKLESVMDWYFNFPYNHRAVVSTTLNDFSNEAMTHEHKTIVQWENNPKRNIHLCYCTYVDDVAKNTIRKLLLETEDKILIAYNSLDGIANIIINLVEDETLKAEFPQLKDEIGILCSERSDDKVKMYLDDNLNVLSDTGYLNKRIVFMTCAYFAGIDIMDKCHLITISSYLQPFTYLSVNRMAQIAGRCRNGNLSETILYDIKEESSMGSKEDYMAFKETLLRKANLYAKALNDMKDIVKEDEELAPLMNYLDYYLTYLSNTKVSKDTSSLRTVRQNTKTHEFQPAYFNIDALLSRYVLKHNLYSSRSQLRIELQKTNNVEFEPISLMDEEHNKQSVKTVKGNKKIIHEQQSERLRQELLDWANREGNDKEIKAISNIADKRLQKVREIFQLLYKSYPSEWLIDTLLEASDNKKVLRNTINPLVFNALPATHKFKSLVLSRFEYKDLSSKADYDNFKKIVKRWDSKAKVSVLQSVFKDLYFSNKQYSPRVLEEFFESIFATTKISGKQIIRSLNPDNFPEVQVYLPDDTNELEFLMLET